MTRQFAHDVLEEVPRLVTTTPVALPAEVRWHGRGGQGVVTASRLLATAALRGGFFPQSLPDFGAERSGAPIAAYTRVGDSPPTMRGPVTNPALVLILDPSLIGSVDVLEGVLPGAAVVVNSTRSPENERDRLGRSDIVICTIDGTAIGEELIGRPLPNVPMLGALLTVYPIVDLETMTDAVRAQLGEIFSERVVNGNIAALQRGNELARSVGQGGIQ
ncbi:MAG: 2-oxoacid:acceptor oxidoreductase family protein [Chloroflexi bacterium]|nr:2-oxoacid:acceptor oxidoreductase family protein [Chloroflexota bacterium]